MKLLQVKVPKKNEYTHEQTNTFLSSLLSSGKKKFLGIFGDTKADVSLNILSYKSAITFLIGVDDEDEDFVKNQLWAQYPNAQVLDYAGDQLFPDYFIELKLSNTRDLPIQTMQDFRDVDPLVSILSPMTRVKDPNTFFWIQMVLEPINQSWQKYALSKTEPKPDERMTQTQNYMNRLIQDKVKYPGFNVYIRLISNNETYLGQLSDSFRVFAKASGNKFSSSKPGIFNKKSLIKGITNHQPAGTPCLLNTLELSTIWHLPTGKVNVPNIMWGKKISLDAPEDLPVSTEWTPQEEKDEITFFAETEYRNQPTKFGIKDLDRNKHMYILGKTGTGKTTMLKNLIIDDIRKGKGVAFLDPHGDAVEDLMNYIPKNRINDVIYFNPSDEKYSYPLNILELPNGLQGELLVSGIISIFHKLYGYSWGPRLEYILRNVLFTLMEVPGSTLVDVIRILTDRYFRKALLQKIDDPTLLQFWNNEFEQMPEKQKQESISPIINKVGQFVTSPLIRRIIGHQKSKVRITEIMDSKKILLCNLSQGRIGEDNAALLGSMLITLIQISAMNRAYQSEEDRIPFYMYVDEFQNFATESFIKILSEARKYKLSLTLANQYIDQVSKEIMSAILGNIGTFVTFAIGAKDAVVVNKEFGVDVEPEDLTDLERFELLLRLSIDQKTSTVFRAHSLRPPKNISGHKDIIIDESRRRYGLPVENRNFERRVDTETNIPEQKIQVESAKPTFEMKTSTPKPTENKTQIQKALPNKTPIRSAKPIPGIITDLAQLREMARLKREEQLALSESPLETKTENSKPQESEQFESNSSVNLPTETQTQINTVPINPPAVIQSDDDGSMNENPFVDQLSDLKIEETPEDID